MIKVLKFGGSSLYGEVNLKHVIRHITNELNSGFKLVVVVSAIGRHPYEYATDTLKRFVSDISNQEMDLLLSVGEIISCVKLSDILHKENIKSIAINSYELGIKTTSEYQNAQVTSVEPYSINGYFDTYDVVIAPGFQGLSFLNTITTLSRGGSDLTAVCLADALNCKDVYIYSDVDGLMTSDPNVVNGARLIQKINYDEVIHMSYNGAKVIHHKALEYAKEKNLRMHLLSTKVDTVGTLVSNDNVITNKYGITGIGSFTNLVQFEIASNVSIYTDNLFYELANANISIDFLNVSPKLVSFTVKNEAKDKTKEVLKKLECKYNMRENCAKISVVGTNIKEQVGVINKIVTPLTRNNIDILQTADSHTTIWILVMKKNLHKSLNILHDSFKLNE